MTDPWCRKVVIGDCTLYEGDCLEVMRGVFRRLASPRSGW